MEIKLPAPSSSPCHLHCVWQNRVSVLDIGEGGRGRGARRKVGRPVSPAFLCFPFERESGPQQWWGEKLWSLNISVCLSVFPGNLLSPLIFHLLLLLFLVFLLTIPVSAPLLPPCLSLCCLSASHPLFGICAHTHPSPHPPQKETPCKPPSALISQTPETGAEDTSPEHRTLPPP